jgi:hypothetical protein
MDALGQGRAGPEERLLALLADGTRFPQHVSAMEQRLEAAMEAWRMGREMMQQRGTSRIPQMHPGSWQVSR